MQLYRYLKNDIAAGIYQSGAKLPSKRVIAEETGISVITVEHAVRLLEEEGYVECRQRSGTVVRYLEEEFLGKTGKTNIELTEPAPQNHHAGTFPFSVLAKTMRRVMLDYGEKLLIKSPNHGCPELRNELCLYLARSRGISVKPSQVIVGSGAEYLYGLIVQMLGTDRIYALEKPSYHKIQEVYQAMGATCDLLKLTQDGIPAEELERTRAQILHVTPFHSFPSGVTADISKKRAYIKWARARNGILIEDNYDSELTVSRKMEESMYSMDPEADIIYVNTFSRTIAPSMRIGYMLLPDRMVDLFHEKLGFYSCTVPIFDQYVLAGLLQSGDFERHVNRVRRQRRILEK